MSDACRNGMMQIRWPAVVALANATCISFVVRQEKRPCFPGILNETATSEHSMTLLHVLVIAHPDDESMFFLPTIRSLAATSTVWILCLTTGDYDGLGRTREKEMVSAGALLGVDKVIVKDDLKDHPTNRWNVSEVSEAIRTALAKELRSCQSDVERLVLITFDEFGVSGHVNHIDTYHGVRALATARNLEVSSVSGVENKIQVPLEAWQLESERNVVLKYVPVVSWIYLLLSFFLSLQSNWKQGSELMYRSNHPLLSWRAMATHQSQFVWYRRLFVVFSCYTYINKLKPIKGST